MDYESMQGKVRGAEKRTALAKEIREARQALEAAELAEGVAERKLQQCRDRRRIAQWRLREIEEAVKIVQQYEHKEA